MYCVTKGIFISNCIPFLIDAFLELLHTTTLTADKGVGGTPPQRYNSDEALNDDKRTDFPDGSAPRYSSTCYLYMYNVSH